MSLQFKPSEKAGGRRIASYYCLHKKKKKPCLITPKKIEKERKLLVSLQEGSSSLSWFQVALQEREDTPEKDVDAPSFFIRSQTWARSAPRLLGKFTKSQSCSKCQILHLSCFYLLQVDSNSGPLKTSPRPSP